MGWDQSYAVENRTAFFLRLLGIDGQALLQEAIAQKLAQQGLSIVAEEVVEGDEDDWYGPPVLERITFSDGQVYVHKLVETRSGDDWGDDYYQFRPQEEDTQVVRKAYQYDETGEGKEVVLSPAGQYKAYNEWDWTDEELKDEFDWLMEELERQGMSLQEKEVFSHRFDETAEKLEVLSSMRDALRRKGQLL